ncbi:MAG: helix-turn-helix transcriptional regulator [Solirubrobacteraceae bacterium]
MLIEREIELGEIDSAVAGALTRDGWLLLFEGGAGIGKTTLLNAARERAQSAGLRVLRARGGELEQEFPYGLVRQLFEPVLRQAASSDRDQLLTGAAGLAAPAVADVTSGGSVLADGEFAVVHGLYWLVANLAQQAPLALVVDDIHWSDTPSLRFLVYLARRLEGLATVMIGSVRTAEAGPRSALINELKTSANTRNRVPAPLSETAVTRMLEIEFDRRLDPEFAQACRDATGGNPFLLHELAAALIADGIVPTMSAIPTLSSMGPATVARATLTRLGRLSEGAVALAQAIAVLGGDARLPHAAALSALDEAEALVALDALVAVNVVSAGARLEFTHPIVRTAIYDDMAPGRRSAAHREVSALLSTAGAEIDTVAGHLLLSTPAGSQDTITTLRDAARHALVLGAPDNAATYLSRALEEGCERELRATLLLELATTEQLARMPAAIEHFEQASRTTNDPALRARAMIGHGQALVYTGDWPAASDLVGVALTELGDSDPALALYAETLRAPMAAYDPRLIDAFEERLPALHEAATATDGGRPLALLLACVAAARGEHPDHVRALVERGWDEGRFLTYGADEMLGQAIAALVISEQLERANEVITAIRLAATVSGSVMRFLVATAHTAWIETRLGNLDTAAAEMRDVFERAAEGGLQFAVVVTLWYCVDVLLERPDMADLATLAEHLELGPMAEVTVGAQMLEVRGRLRFARGETAAAISDLRRAGEIYSTLSFADPAGFGSWRTQLAAMLGPEQREEALEIVTEELADARRIDRARGIGIALRTLGVIEGGEPGRAHLEQAVSVLAGSSAQLEHARALIDLGAMLRRQGSRAAARERLRDGLDLASRCGATLLSERARIELAATGARPRRERVTGRDALTPSELRVARMAAAGRTNQEIAQSLFVSVKTIETHLQHSYSKLTVNSRKQLAAALGHYDGQV